MAEITFEMDADDYNDAVGWLVKHLEAPEENPLPIVVQALLDRLRENEVQAED